MHPKSGARALPPARWRDQSSELHKKINDGEFCSERVRRWRSDLATIANELSGLFVHRQVYDRLGSIVAANPRLAKPNLFLSELFEWYVMTNVVLADRDAQRLFDIVSLANVLHEIAEHPEELSRKAFRKMHSGSAYIPSPRPNELGDDPERDEVLWLIEPLYDQYSAADDRDSLNIDSVRQDIRDLESAAHEVETFRNEVASHRARVVSISSISVASINAYIDTLDRLVLKYEKVLFGAASQTRDPVTQFEWTGIFRFPWIQPEEKGHAVPYAATVDVALTIAEALPEDERRMLVELLNERYNQA